MTPAQRERFRYHAESPKSWPAVRNHARRVLTIDERRNREKSGDMTKGIGWACFLILLHIAAGGV